MEKNIAILIADLSGYTALTETHGPVTAADLIDRYVQIAEKCLVGGSSIHERRGDEIMFVSDCPEMLLATALKLEANTVCEENFLQVHGGLHFGKVLKRADSYFGSAINLASRIAAKASPGTFWCSDDFIGSIEDKSVCGFLSKGNHTFKNISGAKEVFELQVERLSSSSIDPVCRMLIVDRQKAIYSPDNAGHYFCSAQCAELYHASHSFRQAFLGNSNYQISQAFN
ncbi:adenylate/guanylate cyclase domain-containing protein [Foetidibacter luteolus]|uniref:adenylate/guanylate cyclase domain-containing protein n=1 Tax=Foetidibacter luteolus TaxID=2608880 RepID=UPI00129A10B2|nr:adenylate/guanylate cyclase domain-containing protein [Foetidibacter luteolus]